MTATAMKVKIAYSIEVVAEASAAKRRIIPTDSRVTMNSSNGQTRSRNAILSGSSAGGMS